MIPIYETVDSPWNLLTFSFTDKNFVKAIAKEILIKTER